MSRDDEYPTTPRGRSSRPARPSTPLAEGQDTFQPSSPRPDDPARPGKSRPRRGVAGDREPRPVVGGPTWSERVLFGSVSSGHLATFFGQFANYQEAGVDLIKSLSSLHRQFQRSALGPVIGRIEAAVRSGDTIADAMAREPRAFDNLCLAMVRVAEARGGVPETLKLLSNHYEARQRMIRQARSALIYPSIVLSIALIVTFLLSIYVLPTFASLLAELGRNGGTGELPFPSRVLMAFSGFMSRYGWYLVPIGAVGALFGAIKAYGTPNGRKVIDGLSLYVPVLGKLRRKIETGRFARTLGALLNAGVDVGTSLKLTGGVLSLDPFRRAVSMVRASVKEGSELSEAIEGTGRFDYQVVAVVETGEESGKIPEALDKVADQYEEQVEYMVKNLGQLVQPILMVGMGAMVLFIILAVMLPYISAIRNLAG